MQTIAMSIKAVSYLEENIFVDENEETYGLIMDPITSTKLLKNKNIELNKKINIQLCTKRSQKLL